MRAEHLSDLGFAAFHYKGMIYDCDFTIEETDDEVKMASSFSKYPKYDVVEAKIGEDEDVYIRTACGKYMYFTVMMLSGSYFLCYEQDMTEQDYEEAAA